MLQIGEVKSHYEHRTLWSYFLRHSIKSITNNI